MGEGEEKEGGGTNIIAYYNISSSSDRMMFSPSSNPFWFASSGEAIDTSIITSAQDNDGEVDGCCSCC